MELKHTPGPWKHWKYLNYYVVSHEKGQLTTMCFDEHNAKLIAAAPDLLEACIEALKDLSLRNVKIAYTMDLLTEAIKKATE